VRKIVIPPAAIPPAALLFTVILIDDTAWNLSCQDLDPELEEWPDGMIAELAALITAGPCGQWRGWPGPDILADHWRARRQDEWEQSIPVWECNCGASYKIIAEYGGAEYFHLPLPDGLVGERAGEVRRNAKGTVNHSDACPRCGAKFTDTIAGQLNPQQALF
jgi:hypothetical protein